MFLKWPFLQVVGLLLLGMVGGCGTPSLLITPIANTNQLNETVVQLGTGGFWPDKIAIVEVEGMLINARSGGLLQPTENVVSLFTQELDRAAADPGVKAVVLRVNSPGGTVSASDAMYELVLRFKQKTGKPVVASAQELDASGAYYISCAADKIVAQPTTIVGSIGVIFETFNIEGTLNKIGVQSESYKSADHKDIGSPFRAPTDEERRIMQNLVSNYYGRFIGIVAKNRRITDADVMRIVTDGRVFSGDQARTLGLIDQTGLLDDAITLAKQLAKVPNAQVVAYKRPYGYGGSIYAMNSVPEPKSDVLQLRLPQAEAMLPPGFYYMWQP